MFRIQYYFIEDEVWLRAESKKVKESFLKLCIPKSNEMKLRTYASREQQVIEVEFSF